MEETSCNAYGDAHALLFDRKCGTELTLKEDRECIAIGQHQHLGFIGITRAKLIAQPDICHYPGR